MNIFKTIKGNSKSEVVEKKSKFLGFVFYVENVEQAEKYITQIKKEYRDSRHQVFAYNIQNENGGVALKFSDDGEPSGTAGAPILKIIEEKNLSNILIVVVRYFGGILLGTGGLVRAYSEATVQALNNTEIIEKTLGYKVKIYLEYGELEKLKYYLNKNNIKMINVEYIDNIEIIVEISEDKLEEFTKNTSENIFKILKCDILKEKYIDK